MDELRLLRAVSTRLPLRLPKALGLANHGFRRFYCRKPREPVEVHALGLRMLLSPEELVDGLILFGPQLYDYRERSFLFDGMRPGEVVVDLGANVGLYTLLAARAGAQVLAVEPDPVSRARLAHNLALNGLSAVVDGHAVSERAETRRLGVHARGNRGGSSLLRPGDHAVEVACLPLAALLDRAGIGVVHRMKLDIEGLEFAALDSLFASGRTPDRIVVEHHPALPPSPLPLLERMGYWLEPASRHNWLARRTARR